MISSQEFVKGKHNIGYVENMFSEHFKDQEFVARPMPTFQKLPRPMTDASIESELKCGLSSLGDLIAFMDNAPEECKDGYSNLFYFEAFVVFVRWRGEWRVDAWGRGGDRWYARRRVFSPAADPLQTGGSALVPSDPLIINGTKFKNWKEIADILVTIAEKIRGFDL